MCVYVCLIFLPLASQSCHFRDDPQMHLTPQRQHQGSQQPPLYTHTHTHTHTHIHKYTLTPPETTRGYTNRAPPHTHTHTHTLTYTHTHTQTHIYTGRQVGKKHT